MNLEDDWADVRPAPDPQHIDPDRFRKEARTPNGLIVDADKFYDPGLPLPPGHTYRVTEPERFGRFPVRSELTVLPADNPDREPIGWTVREMTQEEIDERNSPEYLAEQERIRNQPASMSLESGACWTTVPVLEGLWGRPWNQAAANWLRSLRPTFVRVIRHGEGHTLDSVLWRVTVQLREDNERIDHIHQEVEVGLAGFRNGQDAGNYYRNQLQRLHDPQGSVIINTRGLRNLRLNHPGTEESVLSRAAQASVDRARADLGEGASESDVEDLAMAYMLERQGIDWDDEDLAAALRSRSDPADLEALLSPVERDD